MTYVKIRPAQLSPDPCVTVQLETKQSQQLFQCALMCVCVYVYILFTSEHTWYG
jgi:hypothetical protein